MPASLLGGPASQQFEASRFWDQDSSDFLGSRAAFRELDLEFSGLGILAGAGPILYHDGLLILKRIRPIVTGRIVRGGLFRQIFQSSRIKEKTWLEAGIVFEQRTHDKGDMQARPVRRATEASHDPTKLASRRHVDFDDSTSSQANPDSRILCNISTS